MNYKIFGHRSFKYLILLGIGIIAFLCYLAIILSSYREADYFSNSDFEWYMAAGKDIMDGNVFLQGWFGATNTFYLLSLLYGVVGFIYGYKVELIAVVSALLFAVMTVLVLDIILRMNRGQGIIRYLKIVFAAAMIFSSCYGKGYGIYAGAHFDAALISLLLFHMIATQYDNGRNVNKLSFLAWGGGYTYYYYLDIFLMH